MAQARAAYGTDLTSISGIIDQQASTYATATPEAAVLLSEVRDSAVLANFDIADTTHVFDSSQMDSDIIGFGVLNGNYGSSGDGKSQTRTSVVNFDVDTSQYATGTQSLLIGFMSPEVMGDGFTDDDGTSVKFQVYVEGHEITGLTRTFTDSTEALAYFNDQTLNIDTSAYNSGTLDVQIKMIVESKNTDDGFATDFILGNSTITPRAVPYIADTSVDMGEMHVGDTVLAGVTVENVANADSDGANGEFTGTNGDVHTNGGSLVSLAAGSSDSSSLQVGVDSSTSGAKSGTATVLLGSDGTVTGTATDFGQEKIAVSGTVFNYASPTLVSPGDLGEVHVGDTVLATLTISNTAPDDGYSEYLDASFTGTTTGATAATSGSIDNLAAAASDNTTMTMALDTSVAGVRTGTAQVNFLSDPNGINALGSTDLGNQEATATVTAYRYAEYTMTPSNEATFIRRGDTVETTLSIANTAVADMYSENLDASFAETSGGTTEGLVDNLKAGDTSTAMKFTLDTSSLGQASGSTTVNFVSDGEGINSLGQATLGSQTVNLAATVTQTASGSVQDAVDFGNVHVDDVVAQAVAVTNTRAAADAAYTDYLDATWAEGAAINGITFSGSVDDLAAGVTGTGLAVLLDTSSAGVKSGAASVNLLSDGDTFGFGISSLGSESVAITGTVWNYAQAQVDATLVDLGNVRQNSPSPTGTIAITNGAADNGYSEKLDTSVGDVTGNAAASGAIDLLAAGSTDSTALSLGLANTATAGTQTGTVTLNFASNGEGTSGLGITTLLSQEVTVTADVFRLAQGSVQTDPVSFVARVGDAVSQSMSVSNTALADGFSEDLDVTASATGNASVSGAISALTAGKSDTTMQVSADTMTAGTTTGTVSFNFASNGQAYNLGDNIALNSTEVGVTSKVYGYANATVTPTIDFGTVRVNTSTTQTATITNTGTGALVDELKQTSSSTTNSAFTASTLANSLTAGTSGTVDIGLNTSTAGVYSGEATLGFASHNSELSDVALSSATVQLTGTVNNLAEVLFFDATDSSESATLTGGGLLYEIDFGTLYESDLAGGLRTLWDEFGLTNSATGPADNLDGTYSDIAGETFTLSGFNAFEDLKAGSSIFGLLIGLDTTDLTVGEYEETFTLNPYSTYEDYYGDLQLNQITFVLKAKVLASPVPVPSSGLLLFTALAGLAYRFRRFKR